MLAVVALVPLLCGFTVNRVGTSTNGAVWTNDQVTYFVDQSGVSAITDGADIGAVYASFAAWNSVDCSTFEFVDGGLVAADPGSTSNAISFKHTDTGWAASDQALAYTAVQIVSGQIRSADIWVNDFNVDWSTNGNLHTYDLQSVITHELGHALGLWHSADPTTTMYREGNLGTNFFRTLSDDDRRGVCFLYPATTLACANNMDCPLLRGGANEASICSGGACVIGNRNYGEDCLNTDECGSGLTCVNFNGPAGSDPGLCTHGCPCPASDACDNGVCVPRAASCDVAACEAAANHHCIPGVDGSYACVTFCLNTPYCGGGGLVCVDPIDADSPGNCRVYGSKANGETCEKPSECVSLICGSGTDGVGRCAAANEVIDPPDPPPDTGGMPDGGSPGDGTTGGGDPNGGDGLVANEDDPPQDPNGSVDGGCASASPSFGLVMGAIVVALFAGRRARLVRSSL